jgi:methyl-accepting chemotaxis protein
MALGKNLNPGNSDNQKPQNPINMDDNSKNTEGSGNDLYKQAIDTGWACIDFEPDGTIIAANENFISALGYSSNKDLAGNHHRMFCDDEYAKSKEYSQFWKNLANGETEAGDFRRIRKDGVDIWIKASYTPVTDDSGKVVRVIKIATDITAEKLAAMNAQGLKDTVDTSFAEIEFDGNGNILSANNNFIAALGYNSLSDIQGKHHAMFVEAAYKQSNHYKKFWDDLRSGETQSGDFKRVTKDGNDLWISAAYTPIQDESGTVIKVIKIATDITAQKLAALNAQGLKDTVDTSFAEIEFEPSGIILDANENFVSALGYNSKEDIVGKHHAMFVENDYKQSHEYTQFWNELRKGETQSDDFKRITKDGKEIWINAAYTPVKDDTGTVIKVIKIASDITQDKINRMNMQGVKDTVDTSFAFITFDPQGIILEANLNFVSGLGYNTASDIVGSHHSIFVDAKYKASTEYKQFWEALRDNKTQSGDFRRVRKDGSEMWIQAAYTPVSDEKGEVVKVIKIATDITAQKIAEEEGTSVIKELKRVINIVNNEGDLSVRLLLDNLNEDNTEVIEGINGLLKGIAAPILEIKSLVAELADGDLRNNYKLDSKGDFKELGDTYNSAMGSLNDLMSNLSEVSNLVASSSEELLTKSDQMQGTTQEVASATQQMAEGAHQQAQQTDEASKLVEEVLKTSNNMATKADSINTAAESGQKSSNEGLVTVKKVVENMSEISDAADQTSKSIDVLTERSEEIARTLNVITDIASQTNLLALNAAIEAARAGDAGRGFAVVAEEIRKLAEDSRKSAVDIQKVITAVQKDITLAGKAIDTMGSSVKSGNQASKEAEEVFGTIGKVTEDTFVLSKDIQGATEEQKGSINETVRNIEKIVVVSEETATGAEQIATSSKDLSRGMDEINDTSKQLATAANQLNDGVSKFKLKK